MTKDAITYDSITVYEGMEGYRKKLSMYMGATSLPDCDTKAPPAVIQMYQEALTNSVDEHMTGYGQQIKVTIFPDNSMQVADAGRGIPEGDKKTLSDAINAVTLMHATGKNDNSGYLSSGVGGTHGVGATGINAGSARMTVDAKRPDGFSYHLGFEKGRLVESEPNADFSDHPWLSQHDTGTVITFLPDTGPISDTDSRPLVSSANWDAKEVAERVRFAAMLNPGLSISFEDQRTGQSFTAHYPEGVTSYWQSLGIDPADIIVTQANVELEGHTFSAMFALAPGNGTLRYFSNGVPNKHGGTHELGFRATIATAFSEYASEKFVLADVLGNINAVVSVSVPSDIVSYDNQTKDSLTTALADRAVRHMVRVTLADALFDNKAISDKIVKELKASVAEREAISKAIKENAKAKKNESKRSRSIATSIDVKKAKSKIPAEREFYLVEGKSASNIGRDPKTQALLPLRGKPLNVHEVGVSKALSNVEVATILEEIGGEVGQNFDPKDCRYGKIILTPDADVDGGHILSLLVLILQTYKPGLIESGKVFYIQSPLFKATKYSKGQPTNRYFYSSAEIDPERERLKEEGWEITRFKGLGEMRPEDAHYALANKKTRRLHQITVEDVDALRSALKMLFGKDTDGRRSWLLEGISGGTFSVEEKAEETMGELQSVDARSLIFGYMAEYFAYVVTSRSVPDARDGLKPVQRRITYQMKELGLTSTSKHMKLAKVSGAVTGNYHPHGSASVSDAAATLSQGWINLVPLVDISGNNGSVTGDSAGADRYIEARPTFLGELMCQGIDRSAVDMVDSYDGTLQEPVILPTAAPVGLINGSKGVAAAGLQTVCLPHNPYEVMALVRLAHQGQLTAQSAAEVYQGVDFPTGNELAMSREEVIADLTSPQVTYTVRARWTASKGQIVIHEVPYGSKTSAIKEGIAKLVDSIPEIVDIFDESETFPQVKIVIELRKTTTIERARQIGEFLEAKKVLTKNLQANNLYIANDRPQYLSVLEQVELFAHFRRRTLTRIWEHERGVAKRTRHLRQAELDVVLNLDEVKAMLDASENKADFRAKISERFNLDKEQAEYIVSMSIHRFIRKDAKRLDSIREAIDQQVAIINDRDHWLSEGMVQALVADVDKTLDLFAKNKVPQRLTTLGKPVPALKKAVASKPKVTSLARKVAVSTTSPVIYCGPSLEEREDCITIDTRTDRYIGAVMDNGTMIVRRVVDLEAENRINRQMDGVVAEDSFLSVFEFDDSMSLLTFSEMGYCKKIPMKNLMPSVSTKRYESTLYKVSGLKNGEDKLFHIYPVGNVPFLEISVTVDSKRSPHKVVDWSKLSARKDTANSSGAIAFDTAKGRHKIIDITITERSQEHVSDASDASVPGDSGRQEGNS